LSKYQHGSLLAQAGDLPPVKFEASAPAADGDKQKKKKKKKDGTA
jgi:hypothetical protein